MTLLEIHRKQFGKIIVRGASTAGEDAERQWDDQMDMLCAGVGKSAVRDVARMPWLAFALDPWPEIFTMPPGGVSSKMRMRCFAGGSPIDRSASCTTTSRAPITM